MITKKVLRNLKSQAKPYFLRSQNIKGLGIKVNPSGSIKFIVETKHLNRSQRRTIGTYPVMTLDEAEKEAITVIKQIHTGYVGPRDLDTILSEYTRRVTLKPSTLKSYHEVMGFYLKDWLGIPVNEITKQMVEKRFILIRDKGINGGKPTYSQATKTMRILSALLNYARADELIDSNPVEVLKFKRIDRSIRKREHYLPVDKVRELLDISAQDDHPVTLAIHLMLFSGLRKNEALRLKWSDVEDVEGISCIIIRDTKNGRSHYVPITPEIQGVLDRAENDTAYIFPSPQKKDSCISDVRPTLKRLTKAIDYPFKCHDLRRTFATRASEVGIDYLMIKRLLNHRSNDITAQYIQWNSRQNLEKMEKVLEVIQY